MRVAFVINLMFNLSTNVTSSPLLIGKSHPVNKEVAVAVAVAAAGGGAGAVAGAVAVALLDVFNEGAHCWEEISSYI